MTTATLTQRDLVLGVLKREGRIEAFDAVYHLTDPEGKPHRITRLAAVIWHLRHVDGYDIETLNRPGMLATYVLRSPVPTAGRPPEPADRYGPTYRYGMLAGREVPEPLRAHACVVCGEPPATADLQPALGDYVIGSCANCGKRTMFTKR